MDVQSQDWIYFADIESKRPVQNVKVESLESVSYADTEGRFDVAKIESNFFAASSIGYIELVVKDFKMNDTIWMSREIITLNPVRVDDSKVKKNKKIDLGYYYLRKDGAAGGDFLVVNMPIAVLIPNEGSHPCLNIESILMAYVSEKTWNYIVSIHSVGLDGRPSDVLFSRTIMAADKVKEIAIEPSTITFPDDGLFISLKVKDGAYGKYNVVNGSVQEADGATAIDFKNPPKVPNTTKVKMTRTFILFKGNWMSINEIYPPTKSKATRNPRFGLKASTCE